MPEAPKTWFVEHKRTGILLALLALAVPVVALIWTWHQPRYRRLRLQPSYLETNAAGRTIAVFVCTNPYPVRVFVTGSVHSYDRGGQEWATSPEGPFNADPSGVFTLRAYAPTNDCLWRFVVFHTVPLDGIDQLRDRWGRNLAAYGWDRVSGWISSGNLLQPALTPLLTNHDGQIYVVQEPK